MLDYAGLEALSAVVREGSFERAAHKLHISPSAVSQQVLLMESDSSQPIAPNDFSYAGTHAIVEELLLTMTTPKGGCS